MNYKSYEKVMIILLIIGQKDVLKLNELSLPKPDSYGTN